MSIDKIRNKKVGYLRVSQSIALTNKGTQTIGGYTQRMAILRLLDEADCSVTFLSEVRKDDIPYLESKGYGYDPYDFDLGDKYDILIVENAATHNLFFSANYNKRLPEGFTEHDKLPLIQIQDRRIATFKGEHVYWQCLDPMLLRLMWMSSEDQKRIGEITTVWHGALTPEPYMNKLSDRVELFSHVKKENYKFFSAKRFQEFLPVNPLSSRNLTLTYLGSKKPRMKVLKDIYLNPDVDYDVHIIGKGWDNKTVDNSPKNVSWWEPVHQEDAIHIMNQTIATVVIGDSIFERSSFFTTRTLEGLYGNCIMMVSDRFANPEKFVFDSRLIVGKGKDVKKAIGWILSQDYNQLILRQREFFKNKDYAVPLDEYTMFDY
jgi:hypothetical protein